MQCPDHVFTLPINANSEINDVEFIGKNIDDTHQTTDDRDIFTLGTNWYLEPTANYFDLKINEPEMKPLPPLPMPMATKDYHINSIVLLSIMIFLLLILIIARKFKHFAKCKEVKIIVQLMEMTQKPSI